MHLYTEWPRLDEGGAEALDEWLIEHPDTRLVVIDTLAKIRKPASGANVYAEDYAALEKLLPLAAKHGVAIVVVHHLRKMAAADPVDEISSSTGLTAGVDGFLILWRTPGSKGPTLYVDGRDIEEPTEYALHWNLDTATWTIEGDAEEVHVSKERADILLTLNRNGAPMTHRSMWRRLVARCHPDQGSDAELFTWAQNVREHGAGAAIVPPVSQPRRPRPNTSRRLGLTLAP